MNIEQLFDALSGDAVFFLSEEHKALREMVRDFAKKELEPRASEYDQEEMFNEGLFRSLGRDLNLFGVTIPESHGGAGMDPLASIIIIEELSSFDAGFALSYLAHEISYIHNLFHSGNQSQIEEFIKPALTGEVVCGLAMTEPEAGTDVLAMKSLAEPHGNYYVLNGTKQFITNGPVGTYFVVYAKTDPSQRGITSFIIDSTMEGVSSGRIEKKMGMKSSPTGQLIFDNVQVPNQNLIGEEDSGLRNMMRNLEIERVALAAQSLGIARRALGIALNYALFERRQFQKPLSEFGQIQRMIAEGIAEYLSARSFVYQSAQQIDPERRRSLVAASCKLVAARMAEKITREMLQVLGGYGYMQEYVVERLLRDSILLSIGGGTNEAMQKNIISDARKLISE